MKGIEFNFNVDHVTKFVILFYFCFYIVVDQI